MQTGKSYAPDVFVTVSRALTTYAQNWANMYKEHARRREVRREQSAEVMDLRMSCLQERLGGFRALDGRVQLKRPARSSRTPSAPRTRLSPLDRCSDVPLLRAVVQPAGGSGDAPECELRERLGRLKARFDAGRWKETLKDGRRTRGRGARLGYQPLLRKPLRCRADAACRSNESAAAEKALTEAFWVADASRHDEVRAEAAANLVFVVGYQQRRFAEGAAWATSAKRVL